MVFLTIDNNNLFVKNLILKAMSTATVYNDRQTNSDALALAQWWSVCLTSRSVLGSIPDRDIP